MKSHMVLGDLIFRSLWGSGYSIYDPCPQDADGGLSNRGAMVGLYIGVIYGYSNGKGNENYYCILEGLGNLNPT